ncbi:MAG: adenylosuccinate synthase [Nitrospira sp.]|nr:adenylosuccinate synthase [Nitrospira sp.]
MAIRAILGLQWGDEGKGKLVDEACGRHDVCARFQGGGNAGHTIYYKGQRVVIHQLPSGVLAPGCINLMGPGMAINPIALLEEIAEIEALGLSLKDRLYISDRAAVTTPFHLEADTKREGSADAAMGTTKKGIWPTYAARYEKIGVRMADLLDDAALEGALMRGIKAESGLIPNSEPEVAEVVKVLRAAGEKLRPCITDTSMMLAEMIAEGKEILIEGAQGAMLDVVMGSYPYVTSSHLLAFSIPTGMGLALNLDEAIGVTKAYCTRVGDGPFPTQAEGEMEQKLRDAGGEYGATTGRPRATGWIDLFALRYICRISGITSLAVTKLDVLTGMGDIKAGIGYEGWDRPGPPADIGRFSALKPVYKTFPGWSDDIAKARSAGDLPAAALDYLRFIEEFTGVKIGLVSVGPERDSAFALHG